MCHCILRIFLVKIVNSWNFTLRAVDSRSARRWLVGYINLCVINCIQMKRNKTSTPSSAPYKIATTNLQKGRISSLSFRILKQTVRVPLRYCFCTYKYPDYSYMIKERNDKLLRRHIRYVNPGSTKFNSNFSSVWYRDSLYFNKIST